MSRGYEKLFLITECMSSAFEKKYNKTPHGKPQGVWLLLLGSNQ